MFGGLIRWALIKLKIYKNDNPLAKCYMIDSVGTYFECLQDNQRKKWIAEEVINT